MFIKIIKWAKGEANIYQTDGQTQKSKTNWKQTSSTLIPHPLNLILWQWHGKIRTTAHKAHHRELKPKQHKHHQKYCQEVFKNNHTHWNGPQSVKCDRAFRRI